MSKNFTIAPLYVNVCLVFLLVSPAFAQSPCDDTQVTLTTQEEVNNFPSQYCSTLCSLTITGNDITNLDSLYVLKRVGTLNISYNPMLVDIDGLSNITNLKSTCFARGLIIEGNNLLGNLEGLSSLTTVSGPIVIRSNTMLQDLDGLSNVDSVGVGDSGNGGWLSIAIGSNASLDDIDGLRGITAVDGQVAIAFNPALQDLNGLASLTRIGPPDRKNIAALVIRVNDAITNLNGLSSLTAVEGYVQIEDNDDLTSILGLSNLGHIGQWTTSSMSLVISNHEELTNLNGLQGLDTIPGTMTIEDNLALADLDGLSSLTAIWGGSLNSGIRVAKNPLLQNMSGLSGIRAIGDARGSYLQIVSNDELVNIGMTSLATISGGLSVNLIIDDNLSLPDLDGLSALRSVTGPVGGAIRITNNSSLQNIDGLSSLSRFYTSNENSFVIADNPNLGQFCGLYTLFNSRGIGGPCGDCYSTNGVVIERNERNPTPEEIEAEGPCGTEASQPTNLVFSEVASDEMRLTFNRARTFASGYIVLMKAYGQPAPEDVPSDGTTYNVGEVLGSSTIVVHNSLDSTFVVTGLIPSTPYYFDIFSWKQTANGPDYLTVNPLEGSKKTLGDETLSHPLLFTNVTSESMTVTIDNAGNGNYITLMKAFGYPSPDDVPVNGTDYSVGSVIGSSTIVVNKGNGSAFEVMWLLPDTRYYFDVYKYDPTTLVYASDPSKGNQSTAAGGSGALTASAEELVPYPNPVETKTSIPFRVVAPESTVYVVIYDMTGREVDVLVSGSFSEGLHEASWNGEDKNGRRVEPGVYVYSVRSEEGVVTGRLAVR